MSILILYLNLIFYYVFRKIIIPVGFKAGEFDLYLKTSTKIPPAEKQAGLIYYALKLLMMTS